MSPRPQVCPDPGSGLLALYDEALPQVYGYLISRCGQRQTAEDLTAETFLAAVETLERPEPPELSTAWLVGVARHKLVDHWRRREREDRGLTVLGGRAEPGGDDPWEVRLDALLTREVLAELGATHRAALILRHMDGLAVPDVAAVLGRGVAATEALLSRARTAFRTAYRTRTEGEEGGPR